MAWGMRNLRIALFGSSIMEGRIGVTCAADRYYMILQRKLSERFPEVCFSIINGAIGGWSTRELMQVFDDLILKGAPDYCLVMFGANNHDYSHPERVLAQGEMERLMADFQARLPAQCQRIGVVLNPIINEWHAVRNLPEWQEYLRISGGLNEICEPERETARAFYRAHGYPVIDLAGLMKDEPERYVCRDGIHLTPAGHELFADAAFRVLEELLIRNGHDTNGRA